MSTTKKSWFARIKLALSRSYDCIKERQIKIFKRPYNVMSVIRKQRQRIAGAIFENNTSR